MLFTWEIKMKKCLIIFTLLYFTTKTGICLSKETQASNENNSNSDKKTQIIPKSLDDNYYSSLDSIFFLEKQILILKKVLNAYASYQNIESKEAGGNVEDVITTPSTNNIQNFNIYLKSIIYSSDDSWTLWINDKKISNTSNKAAKGEYKILNLDKNSATILWTISKIKHEYIHNNIQNDNYKANADGKYELTIHLSVNQTYIPMLDKIIEGKFENNSFMNKNQKTKSTSINNSGQYESYDVELDELLRSF